MANFFKETPCYKVRICTARVPLSLKEHLVKNLECILYCTLKEDPVKKLEYVLYLVFHGKVKRSTLLKNLEYVLYLVFHIKIGPGLAENLHNTREAVPHSNVETGLLVLNRI